MKKLNICLVLFTLIGLQLKVNAQCTPAPPADTDCSSGCTNTLVDNSSVGAGTVYCFTGSGTLNSINMGGGIVRVCGTLTINTINFNSGTIIITSGGSLTFSNGFTLNSSCTIVNYGTFNAASISMQNGDNSVYNYGTFDQSGTIDFGNSTASFINGRNAKASVNTISKNNGNNGTLCLEAGSSLEVETFSNAQLNFVSYGSTFPNACIRITASATSSADLTSSASVEVCLASDVGDGQSWGSAEVTDDCNTCEDVLPVTLVSFDAKSENGFVKLAWSTISELNNDYFVIERSQNGLNYNQIGQVKGAGNSLAIQSYNFFDDEIPVQNVVYYRLKQVDMDGSYTYSKVLAFQSEQFESLSFFPNPALKFITVDIAESKHNQLFIYNSNGQLIKQVDGLLPNQQIDISELPVGVYVMKMISNNKLEVAQLVKQ